MENALTIRPQTLPGLGSLTLKVWEGPLGPYVKHAVPLCRGWVISDYIPKAILDMDVVSVKLNGLPLDDEAIEEIVPKHGDEISLMPIAGGFSIGGMLIASAISLVIGVVLKTGEYHWKQYSQIRRAKHEERAGVGLSYGLEVMENVYEDGAPIPVLMGKMRAGGIVLQQYTDSVEEGIDRLQTLIGFSEGPIESLTIPHVDGNLLTNYPAASMGVKLGTIDQAVLEKFRDTVSTIAVNNQLLADAAVIVLGNTACERFKLKVSFPSGVYHIDSQGDYHSALWRCKIEYRPNAGGAWTTLYWKTTDDPMAYVDQDSLSGTNNLYLSVLLGGISGVVVGGIVIIDEDGPREEVHTITGIGLDHVVLAANLTTIITPRIGIMFLWHRSIISSAVGGPLVFRVISRGHFQARARGISE